MNLNYINFIKTYISGMYLISKDQEPQCQKKIFQIYKNHSNNVFSVLNEENIIQSISN